MTAPADRTKSVVDTRRFLETLVASDDRLMWDLVRSLAMMLLRHYPQIEDISKSARALPSVWSTPSNGEQTVPASDTPKDATSLVRLSSAYSFTGLRPGYDDPSLASREAGMARSDRGLTHGQTSARHTSDYDHVATEAKRESSANLANTPSPHKPVPVPSQTPGSRIEGGKTVEPKTVIPVIRNLTLVSEQSGERGRR
ncbi:BPSL0761 family protein [Paraburkholderia phenoliruptrix]|uniref:BPSL0761 family protein n=1 Tax=Paraburkholderia phenoliruptrix TaxID=252970 RepID=UPI002869BDEA|nr:BPSL0761 family protein [Paraburkholderia phenoliruptrix]